MLPELKEYNAPPELLLFFDRIISLRDFANQKSKEEPENETLIAIAKTLSEVMKAESVDENIIG